MVHAHARLRCDLARTRCWLRDKHSTTRLSAAATAQSACNGAPHVNARSRQAAFAKEMARWLDAPVALRYGTATVIAVVALLAKYALLVAGLDSFFLLLVPAILVGALLGGVGPGILATCITGVATYLTIDPAFQIGISDPPTGGRLALFLVDGVILSLLAGALRDAMRQLRASRAEAELEHGRTVLLQDLTARLAAETDPAAIAQIVIDRSSSLVSCDRAWVTEEVDGAVRVLGSFDQAGTADSQAEDGAAAILARLVIDTGEELWVEADADADTPIADVRERALTVFAALAAVPLARGDGRPFGALLLGWRGGHHLMAANRDLKRAIGRITAQALERAELYALQAARIEDFAEREVVREAFLAVLSHELRTPVTTIFGASALLTRGEDDETGLLGDIRDEADRLRRIVDDLLVLSRSERGAIQVEAEPVLLQRRVRAIVEDIGHRHPQADLAFDAPRLLPPAEADPTALVQVVHNLVTNAIKYAGEDGRIDITIAHEGEMAAVSVADHGPGLGDDSERVFELFHRAAHTRKRASGTGIGLYVARELVRAMGGEVIGANRPEGGALFRFTLPLAETVGQDDPGEVDMAGAGRRRTT
jgi:two-component system, OmpR family, sensor histidine kinase KdpD